jgi:hypothetical protein
MARIPTFQRQQRVTGTTGVQAPREVTIQNHVGDALGNLGSAMGQVGETLFRAETASQVSSATANAKIKMAALRTELDNGDPATAIGTYDARAETIRNEAASALGPVALEEFDKRFTSMSADGKIHNNATVVKKRFSEMKGGLVTDLDTFAKASTGDGTAMASGMSAIDASQATNVITAAEAAKLKIQFRGKLDTAAATRMLTSDPQGLIDGLKNPKILPDLDPVQRAKFLERAETRLTRQSNAAKTQAAKVERTYLAGANEYAKAVAAGGDVSPVLASRFSDAQIRASIADPDEAEMVIAKIRNSEKDGKVMQTIAGSSPAEIKAILDDAKTAAEHQAQTPAEVSILADDKTHQARVQRAIAADTVARNKDAGQYVISNDDTVKAAFGQFNEAINSGDAASAAQHYESYKHARDAAYDRMGINSLTQRPLANFAAKQMVEMVQGAFSKGPEAAAQIFQRQATAFGDDYDSVLKQLVDEGLNPVVSSLGYIDAPLVRQELLRVMKPGQLDAMKVQIGKDAADITKELNAGFVGAMAVAGSGNSKYMVPVREAATALAISRMASGSGNVTAAQAAKSALDDTLHSSFQIVNLPKLKGMVPKAAGAYDEHAVQRGATAFVNGSGQYKASGFDKIQLDLGQFEQKIFGGVTDPDKRQALAHQMVKANITWAFGPKGETLIMMDTSKGVPVKDINKKPITIDPRQAQTFNPDNPGFDTQTSS